MSEQKPVVSGNTVRWPGFEPSRLDEQPQSGGPTATERQAVRNSLNRDKQPDPVTLEDYYAPAAVAARVKKLQEGK